MKTTTYSKKSKLVYAGRKAIVIRTPTLLIALVLCLAMQNNTQAAVTQTCTKSVLITWPEVTEDCIVIATDIPTNSSSVWAPYPQPIFRHCGERCVAAPASGAGQEFRLVLGTQFIDDFSEPKEPFGTRNPWVPYFWGATDATRYSFTVTDGKFRIQTLGRPIDGRIFVAPPGILPVLADFTASVDILSFAASGWAGVGLYGRGTITMPVSNSNGYYGQMLVNPPGLSLYDGTDFHNRSLTFSPGTPYRLQLSAVGNKLALRLVNLTTGEPVGEVTTTETRLRNGYVTLAAIWGQESCDVTLDNFSVTGTKP